MQFWRRRSIRKKEKKKKTSHLNRVSQHAGSAASPPNADCTHCSSLSSSGPRRLLLPPSGTLAEYWNLPGATHGHIRTAWAPDWSESTVPFFKNIFFLAAFINIIALPVTMSALVVFILLPLAQAQEVSVQQLCCPWFDCSLLLHSAYQNLFLFKQILAYFSFPLRFLLALQRFEFDQVFRWTRSNRHRMSRRKTPAALRPDGSVFVAFRKSMFSITGQHK